MLRRTLKHFVDFCIHRAVGPSVAFLPAPLPVRYLARYGSQLTAEVAALTAAVPPLPAAPPARPEY